MKFARKNALLAGTMLGLIPATASAQAMDRPLTRAPAATMTPEDQAPGDIIVTAQRRSESLQKVPLTVTVATKAMLAARNFSDPSQLPFLVPNLQVTNFQASPGAVNYSIRGIGTASFSNLVEPSVATVIDGIVMGRPEMGVMAFSDLERVEVLEGPQGMLFGKNASAGLVNIVTTRPKIGLASLDAEASYGNVDAASHANSWRANATVNLPINATLAARLSAYWQRDGSLIGNKDPNGFSDFGRTQYGTRAKLLYDNGDGFTLYLSGDYSHSSGIGTGLYTARSDAPGGKFAAIDSSYGVVASPENFYQLSDAPTNYIYKVGGVQAEASYQFDSGVSITNIFGWRAFDSDRTIDFDLRPTDIDDVSGGTNTFRQITEELRAASPSGSTLEYQAGLFFYHGFSGRTDINRGQLGFAAPPPGYSYWLGLDAVNNLRTNSYAAYGQATWHITSKLGLTAGGRVTHDDLHLFGAHDNGDALIGVAGEPGPHTYTPSQSHTDFSWRTSARYEFTPQVSAYVTVARGYKGPGYNLSWSGVPGASPVGAETSMNYEAGVKSTLFRRLLLDASVYTETFDNFQVQSFRSTDIPGVGTFLIQNAGTLRARGVTGNFSYRAGGGLTISGGGAYNDAIYKKFVGAPCYPGQTVAEGCVNKTTDASGNQLVNAPKWTATLAADFETPVSERLRGLAHVDAYYRSSVFFQANEDPNTRQSGYTTINGSIGLGDLAKRWTATLFCRNCTNKHFVTFIESNPAGTVGDYGQSFALDSFRTIGAKIAFHF